MPFFRHSDLSLHYMDEGSGEPVMLIHGLGCSGTEWGLQIPLLRARGFRVIVPDLPGSGASAPTRGNYSIPHFAEILWRLIDDLAIPHVNLVGFSMGGAIALQMAIDRPEIVPRLALINSLCGPQERDQAAWA